MRDSMGWREEKVKERDGKRREEKRMGGKEKRVSKVRGIKGKSERGRESEEVGEGKVDRPNRIRGMEKLKNGIEEEGMERKEKDRRQIMGGREVEGKIYRAQSHKQKRERELNVKLPEDIGFKKETRNEMRERKGDERQEKGER